MSSLLTASRRAAPRPTQAARSIRASGLRTGVDPALGLGLGAALAVAALITGGGVSLAPNTWVEIALALVAAALAVGVLLWGGPGRAWGGVALILFAAVAALTAVSIAWSVAPEHSWLEANRTLSYLAVFGAALALGRLMPERWPAMVGAIGVAATALAACALLVKVFPATFDPQATLGRLRLPFDYWNAVGLVGGLGIPACLWAGARRDRGRVLRALAVPGIAVLMPVIVLSYSRSALLAAVVGAGCWFAIVPLRLRGALVLALGLSGGGALTLWALATHPITHDRVPLAARSTAGHAFGLLLLLVLVLLTVAGLLAAFAMDRAALSRATRRRIGTALVTLVALIPLGGVAALAVSTRGLTGEVSHIWGTLTSTQTKVGDSPGRLLALDSSRPGDWKQGLTIAGHALLKGVGAQGYGTARTRYTRDTFPVQHAHSYVIETLADFGLLGLVVNLALLVAWALAALRTIGRGTPRDGPAPPPEQAAQRAGMLTLLCVVVVFGVSSTIDWTWFVPGVTLPALASAGWLAGRGPLAQPVARRAGRRRLSISPVAGAVAVGLVTVALLLSWAIWQPLRSSDAEAAAITAIARGETGVALSDARTAAARDPLAVEPLWEQAAILAATGDLGGAHAELVQAVALQPENSATWLQLGLFQLQHHQPRRALGALRRALRLNLNSIETAQAIKQAQEAALRASASAGHGARQ